MSKPSMTVDEARKIIAAVHARDERMIGLHPLDAGAAPGCLCTLAESHEAWRLIREQALDGTGGQTH
jgi:hypothetical protein